MFSQRNPPSHWDDTQPHPRTEALCFVLRANNLKSPVRAPAVFFFHSWSWFTSHHSGLISTETQIHKWNSFPMKQHFHQYHFPRYAYCVSRGRISDVRHLRSFYHKQPRHKLIDVLWSRPCEKTQWQLDGIPAFSHRLLTNTSVRTMHYRVVPVPFQNLSRTTSWPCSVCNNLSILPGQDVD